MLQNEKQERVKQIIKQASNYEQVMHSRYGNYFISSTLKNPWLNIKQCRNKFKVKKADDVLKGYHPNFLKDSRGVILRREKRKPVKKQQIWRKFMNGQSLTDIKLGIKKPVKKRTISFSKRSAIMGLNNEINQIFNSTSKNLR